MALFKPIRKGTEGINATPIADGQFLIDIQTGDVYTDINNVTRKHLGNIGSNIQTFENDYPSLSEGQFAFGTWGGHEKLFGMRNGELLDFSGTHIFTGEVPDVPIVKLGDLYINLESGDVYRYWYWGWELHLNIKGTPGADGANGVDGINGIDGTPGADGANGSQIFIDEQPYEPIAKQGDIYIDSSSGDMFRYYGDGWWEWFICIKGAQGVQGPQGAQGVPGPPGEQGDIGTADMEVGTFAADNDLGWFVLDAEYIRIGNTCHYRIVFDSVPLFTGPKDSRGYEWNRVYLPYAPQGILSPPAFYTLWGKTYTKVEYVDGNGLLMVYRPQDLVTMEAQQGDSCVISVEFTAIINN